MPDVGSGWFGRRLWLSLSSWGLNVYFCFGYSFDGSSLNLDHGFDSGRLDLNRSGFGWRRSSGAWRWCCWLACWWAWASWTQWLGHR
jgi:hypothetical protein